MYVKIHNRDGDLFLNEHKVMIIDQKYVVDGKTFDRLGEAAIYIAKKDKLPYPGQKLKVIKQEPPPESPPALPKKWVTIGELREEFELTKNMAIIIREKWEAEHPKEFIKQSSGSLFKKSKELYDFIKILKHEIYTNRPYGCPDHYISINQSAKNRGITVGTINTYIIRGEISSKYWVKGTYTKPKYFLDPNWKRNIK